MSIFYRATFNLLCSLALIFAFSGCKKIETAAPFSGTASDELRLNLLTKPNIILIVGDDVGYEIPTVDGGGSYNTPNLDKMASEGIRFTQCHSTPLCSPSRVQLMTGKYNFRNYVDWGVLDTSNRTIANLLRDQAGYKTLVCGKWAFGGGDQSIHALGYDDYMVWNPFTGSDEDDGLGAARYKNPVIYTAGNFLPKAATRGKYGDDMFTDYIKNFINNNVGNSFFIYYPLCLVHPPFSPTPLDPEFATWQNSNGSDPKFFPSMVNYMDAKVGDIINHVKQKGIDKNTIVLFVGDNGTSGQITSIFNGLPFRGGKSTTTEAGTRVAFIAQWPSVIVPGAVNEDLIDFSDFLPTLAYVAQTTVPVTYGKIDGVNFGPRLKGEPGTPRKWVYCYFYPNPDKKPDSKYAWVQTTTYKLYDTLTIGKKTNKFYNIGVDPDELNPLKAFELTKEEKRQKRRLAEVLGTMHN